MLDRALLAESITFRETPGGDNVSDRLRDYLRRFLRWLSRLIEAGGPMS
jgi:hypothetical protein